MKVLLSRIWSVTLIVAILLAVTTAAQASCIGCQQSKGTYKAIEILSTDQTADVVVIDEPVTLTVNAVDWDSCGDPTYYLDTPLVYTWSGDYSGQNTTGSVEVSWSTPGIKTIYVSVDDDGLCAPDDPQNPPPFQIIVIPPPAPPPPDDYPGAEPGDEDELPPIPENIIYYPDSEPAGYVTTMELNPDTGEMEEVVFCNDELLVRFVPEATLTQIDQALQSINAWKKEYCQWLDFWAIGFDPVADVNQLWAKRDLLAINPLVVSVDESPIGLPAVAPNDDEYGIPGDSFSGQWNLKRIGMEGAWVIEKGSEEITPTGSYCTVGVVDSGVDKDHFDLAGNLRSESDRDWGHPHGAECTGIISAVTNNDTGDPGFYSGVASLGWHLQAISKFASTNDVRGRTSGHIHTKRVIYRIGDILRYPTPGGVASISMSFGGRGMCVEGAINDAFKRGVLCVASTGNDNSPITQYRPAIYTRVMAIGATDIWRRDGNGFTGPEKRVNYPGWWGSNWGNCLSVMAPGISIPTTCLDNQITLGFSGTSAATPHVAGLAALVRGEFQSMRPLDIRHRIEDTASDNVVPNKDGVPNEPIPGWDQYTGWGFIKADQALASDGSVNHIIQGNKTYLLAIPVWPKENTQLNPWKWQASAFPQNVLPPAPPGGQRLISQLKFGTRDQYYTQDQYDANGYPRIGLVRPYTAFWVKYKDVPGNVTITASGAKAGIKDDHWLEFKLNRGNNFIANPFLGTAITFDNDHIKFRRGDVENYKSLSEATGKWIGKTWYWNADTATWIGITPNTGHQMQPFKGYCIYNNEPLPVVGGPTVTTYMLIRR